MTGLLSLNGLRVLNTRAAHQAQLLEQQITMHQGSCIPLPILHIEPIEPPQGLDKLQNTACIDKAIFTSVNAVECFFQAAKKHGFDFPASIETFAIGSATQQALSHYKISALCAEKHSSEGLLNHPSFIKIKDQAIIIIKGAGGRTLLSQTLRQRKAQVNDIIVYQRRKNFSVSQLCERIWQNDAVDIILGSSQFVIETLFSCFNEEGKRWLCGKPWVVFSERLMRTAQKMGVRCVIVSEHQQLIKRLSQFSQGLVHDKK